MRYGKLLKRADALSLSEDKVFRTWCAEGFTIVRKDRRIFGWIERRQLAETTLVGHQAATQTPRCRGNPGVYGTGVLVVNIQVGV
jgi:hypothetical protein